MSKKLPEIALRFFRKQSSKRIKSLLFLFGLTKFNSAKLLSFSRQFSDKRK